jgi:BirA family biotin operon repressor/biotin-[acetyl-CoA-carboxylase] ligase
MLKYQTYYYQEVTSTNSVLKEKIRFGNASEGTVILAEYQTSGRGRGKNRWESEPGKNLLVSILFFPGIMAGRFFLLNEFISLAIVDAISGFGIDACVKWPNDVYLKDKKVAGLLIENSITSQEITQCIAGIGLNLNQRNFPAEIPNPVSLIHHLDRETERQQFLDILLDKLNQRYGQLKAEKYSGLNTEYNTRLYKLGEQISYFTKDTALQSGILKEVSEDGKINIQTGQSEKQFLFGEIELIL